MTLEETIRDAVRAEVGKLLTELRRLMAERIAEDRYLSVRAAADHCEVHPDTIRSWIKAGQLAEHHAGRELRVRLSDHERFMTIGTRRNSRPSVEEEAENILSRSRR